MLKEGWSHAQSDLIIPTSQTEIYVTSLKDFTIFYLELLLIACASSSTRYCHLMRWKYRTSWTTWFPKKIYYSLSCKYLKLLGMVLQQSGRRFFFTSSFLCRDKCFSLLILHTLFNLCILILMDMTCAPNLHDVKCRTNRSVLPKLKLRVSNSKITDLTDHSIK